MEHEMEHPAFIGKYSKILQPGLRKKLSATRFTLVSEEIRKISAIMALFRWSYPLDQEDARQRILGKAREAIRAALAAPNS
ncbi:hypothetical protein [Microbacterium sp. NPDC076911]|uniref:hypothetical protein n=1 Tax=Microbacterium sp. NPDC076911 TaxID=3154958 RepID=UPI0034390C0E